MDREREAIELAMKAGAQAAAVSDLASSVDDLNGELRSVALDLAEERVWRRRFVSALLILGLVLVLLGVVAVQNYQNGRIVRDTIDPGGERYQRNQKAQAAVVGQLVTDDDLADAEKRITDCLLGRGPCPGDS